MDRVGAGADGTNWENSIEIYTLPYGTQLGAVTTERGGMACEVGRREHMYMHL